MKNFFLPISLKCISSHNSGTRLRLTLNFLKVGSCFDHFASAILLSLSHGGSSVVSASEGTSKKILGGLCVAMMSVPDAREGLVWKLFASVRQWGSFDSLRTSQCTHRATGDWPSLLGHRPFKRHLSALLQSTFASLERSDENSLFESVYTILLPGFLLTLASSQALVCVDSSAKFYSIMGTFARGLFNLSSTKRLL